MQPTCIKIYPGVKLVRTNKEIFDSVYPIDYTCFNRTPFFRGVSECAKSKKLRNTNTYGVI